MSELLRDDHQDNMFIADIPVVGVSATGDETARAAESWQFALMVSASSAAKIADGADSDLLLETADTIKATGAAVSLYGGTLWGNDKAKVSDGLFMPWVSVVEDTARLAEVFVDSAANNGTDMAVLADKLTTAQTAAFSVADRLRITDGVMLLQFALAEDEARISDTAVTAVAAAAVAADTAALSDDGEKQGDASGIGQSAARISDGLFSRLITAAVVHDVAEADDDMPAESPQEFQAAAWTANSDNWAMSRYVLGGWHDVAVIGGVLYGFTQDGIYRLGDTDEESEPFGNAENILAWVRTGKVDIGRGALAHPTGAYLEYSLKSGHADMVVTQTQQGSRESYTYRLKDGKTDELTNGRFIFGRGLRGRHFEFELKLSGAAAHVHDLRIDAVPTKRRI